MTWTAINTSASGGWQGIDTNQFVIESGGAFCESGFCTAPFCGSVAEVFVGSWANVNTYVPTTWTVIGPT